MAQVVVLEVLEALVPESGEVRIHDLRVDSHVVHHRQARLEVVGGWVDVLHLPTEELDSLRLPAVVPNHARRRGEADLDVTVDVPGLLAVDGLHLGNQLLVLPGGA